MTSKNTTSKMPSIRTIQEILNPIAPIALYLSGNDSLEKKVFHNADIDERLAIKIFVETEAVQRRYDYNPSDATLRGTSNYLYSMLNKYALLALRVVARLDLNPPTITNPANVSIEAGQLATFTVAVTSELAYTLQWFRNGVAIPGATGLSYSLVTAQADSGAQFSAVATSTAGSAPSGAAILTVNAQLLGQYYYGAVSYIADIKNGVAASIPWSGNFNVVNGQPIAVTLPRDLNNEFLIIRYPDSQAVKLNWENTPQNSGTIPDQLFDDPQEFGGYHYAFFRIEGSLESSLPVTLT